MSYTYKALPLPLGVDVPVLERESARHGVVYTKPWVANLILDLAGYDAARDLAGLVAIEPAAGAGSFLVPTVERLAESCRRHGRSLASCATALLAFELDPESAGLARNAVVAALTEHGVRPGDANSLASSWVRTGDYLLNAPSLPPADIVVGNPPYIRIEDMDEVRGNAYRRRYATMVGRADLYVAFFEAALKGLKPGGVCAFVCADRWMRNQYGVELRRLVTSGFAVEAVVEMHRADAFETEVSAYPAITVIRRGGQGSAIVAAAEPGVERADTRALHRALRDAPGDGAVSRRLPGLTVARVEGWFEGGDPWPIGSPERLALLKRLESEFAPLESEATGTKVGIGVATGADRIFITKDATLVDRDRLLRLAIAADTRSGLLRWSGHYLVNPWNEVGLVSLHRHPRLRSYLEAHESKLRSRHVGKRNAAGWFRTINRVDPRLTGRTKLYIADIKDRLNPVLDKGTTYPHHNLYWVASTEWDMEVLGGLLLSDVAQLFVECYGVRMRGGYLRFQAQYLRRIRLPRPHDVSAEQAGGLRSAFRHRDRARATEIALGIYGIDRLPGAEE